MITRLEGYRAEAEILGVTRKVEVTPDRITIEGIEGLAEAGRILDALSGAKPAREREEGRKDVRQG